MKKNIFKILIVVFSLVTLRVNGQSIPMYSQYMYNMSAINPANAGNRGVPSIAFTWRDQWAGLPGAPSTKSITFDMPSESKKFGFGMQLFDDKYTNYIKRSGVSLINNFKIVISEKGVLSLGLKYGFYNDLKLLTDVYLGGVDNKAHDDPAFASNFNKIIPLIGAGLYYHDDHFYAGISVPDFVIFQKTNTYTSDLNMYHVNQKHYFFTTGCSIDVNDDVSIKPSTLIKIVSGAPIQADLNANIWLKNTIGLGASYRTGESVLGMAEVQVSPQFRIGYAYDLPFKRPNTSELFLRFEFGKLFPNSKTIKIY